MISTSTVFASKNVSNIQRFVWSKCDNVVIPLNFSKWVFNETQLYTMEHWFDKDKVKEAWDALASLNQTASRYSEALEDMATYYLENIALVNQSIVSDGAHSVVLAAFPYIMTQEDPEFREVSLPGISEPLKLKQWGYDTNNKILRIVDKYLQSNPKEYLAILEDFAYKYPFTHNRVSYTRFGISLTDKTIEENLLSTVSLKEDSLYASICKVTGGNSCVLSNGFELLDNTNRVTEYCQRYIESLLTRFNIASCWLAREHKVFVEMDPEFLWYRNTLGLKLLKNLNINKEGVKKWRNP